MKCSRSWLLCLALFAHLARPATAAADQRAKPALAEEAQIKKLDAFSQAVFKTTKQSVEARLENLDEKANNLFDQGTEIAIASMTATIEERLAPYKSTLFGPPAEADQIYADGKKQLEQEMKALSVRVANVIADEVAGAKREIESAEAQIAAEYAKLPAKVRARAAKQQAEYAVKLGALEHRAEATAR